MPGRHGETKIHPQSGEVEERRPGDTPLGLGDEDTARPAGLRDLFGPEVATERMDAVAPRAAGNEDSKLPGMSRPHRPILHRAGLYRAEDGRSPRAGPAPPPGPARHLPRGVSNL